jgi:HEAT repeat protein
MATEDPNKTVRDAAGAALAQAGFPHSRRLLAAALDSPQEELRARAMSLLGALGGPEAARHLVEALSDPAPQVRQTALDSLSRLELSPARDRLLAELRNPDPAVRAGVAALIARLRAPQAASALVEALADPEDEVRANALAALAALGRPARKHRAALSDRLNDPSPRVREAAAAALAALRAAFEQAGEATELLRQGPLSNAGAAALIELAAGGDLEPLLRALETPQSAQSLASFLAGPGRQRLQPLLAALRQAEQRDQVRAVAALSQALRLEGAADSYLAELRAIDPGVRLMAVEIAGLLATPQAVHALVQVLEHDPVAEVRSRAASVLADAPGEPVQAALLRAHNEDADERVRHIAGHALRTGRRPEAGPALFPGAAPPGETAPAAAEPSS